MLGGEAMFGPDLLDAVPELLPHLRGQADVVRVPSDRVFTIEVLEQESELLVGQGDRHPLQCIGKIPLEVSRRRPIFCRRH